MTLMRLALRSLLLRPARTVLTIISVAASVAVLFSLLAFNTGYQKGLRNQLQQMGVHLMVVPIGCPYEAASLVLKGGEIEGYLDERIVDDIARLEGVAIAAPSLMHAIVRPEDGRTDIYLGIDQRQLDLKNWWRLGDGSKPSPDLLASDDALLLGYDAALIEKREAVGEKIWVPEIDSEFTVTGILEPTGTQDDGFFYLPLATAQRKFNLPAQITAVQVRLSDPSQAAEVGDRLEQLFANAEVIRMEELLGSMTALMDSARALILAIVAVVIAISAVGVLNTMLMSVFERTREIGVLRATGASRLHIFSLVWTETLALTAVGGIGGIALAAVASRGVEAVIRQFVPLAPRESMTEFDPQAAVICVLAVLCVGLAAGVYPALRAASIRTIEALRSE
ncbi:MAG TPA: ABC transporter permease [Armatimonadetes bacterium]|jgi:putative ABC transport system permease protein|nr:ABC transporter permease [Armatimonadota bacterium]